MSVQTYVPGDVVVHMSQAAQEQARREIRAENARGLRLGVKASGCSGYMYVMDYVHDEQSTDTQVTIADGVTLFVDDESLPIVNGTEIDYVTEGVNSFFKFLNPNATGECGCGESFTVTS